jgi:hypothetical protein
MTSEKYVAEFSPSQCRFHVHTQSDREEAERRAQEKMGHPSDYQVLGEFDTQEEAVDFIAANKKSILEQGVYLDPSGRPVYLYTKN